MRYRPIRNSAQLTPSAVHFQTCRPPTDLAPYVTDFWQYDVLDPHPFARIQVFPSGCVVLRFDIGPHQVTPLIYGPSLRPDMKSVFVAGTSVFGVALRLGLAATLIGCDIGELRDQRLDLEVLWPGATDEPCHRLWREKSFKERAAVLTGFLRRRLRQDRMPHADFFRAVQYLSGVVDGSGVPLGLGVSKRTLRRHFERYAGISPKQVTRVMRVQAAMRALADVPKTPRSRLALDTGFSDQPHFNREFKGLLGMSPGEFTRYSGRFHEPTLPIWNGLNRRIPKWGI